MPKFYIYNVFFNYIISIYIVKFLMKIINYKNINKFKFKIT